MNGDETKLDVQLKELKSGLTRIEDKFDLRLKSIEEMLTTIAVQQVEIRQIRGELGSIWGKINDLTKPDGTISIIKNHQAKCPRFTINDRFDDVEKAHNDSIAQIRWIFGGVGVFLVALSGTFIKILIDLNHLALEVGKLIK